MSSVLEKYEKVKTGWKNINKSFPYDGVSKKNLFELVYHSSNEVPFRCIHVVTKPGEDESGNEAVLYSALDKIFISIIGKDDAVELTLYAENEDTLGKIDKIGSVFNENFENYKKRSENLQDQIAKTILVERKMDEVVNLATNKDLARKVYFAIGEVRERGALIDLMMLAPKVDVVQLAVMKWMNIALNEDQDKAFPEAKVKGLVKNFLQLKKWLMDLINRSFTESEEKLFPKEQAIEEE